MAFHGIGLGALENMNRHYSELDPDLSTESDFDGGGQCDAAEFSAMLGLGADALESTGHDAGSRACPPLGEDGRRTGDWFCGVHASATPVGSDLRGGFAGVRGVHEGAAHACLPRAAAV